MDPMLTGVLIVLASILILSTARFIHGKKKRSRNLPPGSFGWPVVGESLEFLRLSREGTPEKFVADRVRKYKSGVFKTSLMGEAVAVLSGPAGNKFLFSNGNKLVATWWPASVQKLLGVCLTTSAGEEGKKMKKLMSYFVSPAALQQLYIKDMDYGFCDAAASSGSLARVEYPRIRRVSSKLGYIGWSTQGSDVYPQNS